MKTKLNNIWVKHFLYITGIYCVFYFLMLFMDGVYWDGWLIYDHLQTKDYLSLKLTFEGASFLPLAFYIHRFFGFFHDIIFAYRITFFVLLLFTGYLTYLCLYTTKVLKHSECLFLTLVFLLYPVHYCNITIICIPKYFLYLSFLSGVLLSFISFRLTFTYGFIIRILSHLFFLFSFNLNSLLPFYFGFLLFHLYQRSETFTGTFYQRMMFAVKKNLDYILLPFLFWGLLQLLADNSGRMTQFGYNTFILAKGLKTMVHSIVFCISKFYIHGINRPFSDLISYIIYQPVFYFLVAAAAYTMHMNPFDAESAKKPKLLMAFGLLLLFLAVFPYVAVGKSPNHGWSLRHAFLLPLPMGFILLGLLRYFFDPAREKGLKYNFVLSVIILFSFGISTMNGMIHLQYRFIKDKSVISQLRKNADARKYSVFYITDRYHFEFPDEFYRFYEWCAIFKQAWEEETHLGIDMDHKNMPAEKIAKILNKNNRLVFLAADVDMEGRQAAMHIEKGKKPIDLQTMAMYFYYRYVQPQKMPDFLNDLVSVTIDEK